MAACPDESLPEFAFIGRSNVGKSSLLNYLAGQEGLARVSATPGFTKMINIFTMNKNWRLVDLPGYGFAQGAKKDTAKFNKAVSVYLRNRTNLTCVFSLIDSSLEPQEIDLEFVEWLVRNEIPFVLVFTKTDKVGVGEVPANITAFMDCIAPWFVELPKYFTCSVKNDRGRQELLGVIDEALTAIYAESNQAALEPGEVAPTRKEKAKAARPKRPNPARPW